MALIYTSIPILDLSTTYSHYFSSSSLEPFYASYNFHHFGAFLARFARGLS